MTFYCVDKVAKLDMPRGATLGQWESAMRYSQNKFRGAPGTRFRRTLVVQKLRANGTTGVDETVLYWTVVPLIS